MDLTEIVTRCQQGDELAWEMLVRQHQSQICAVAFNYVKDVDEARDLAQDIFVRIYQRLATCDDPQRFLAWMLSIARNACIDHLRRRKARPPRHDLPAEEMFDLADPGPDPEQTWVRSSRKRLVYRAMQKLSKINCEIILLKDMQGLPLEEIAQMLDLPLGTVKSRSSRARLELAKAVIDLGDGNGAEAAV